jgi:hypothetical protein
MKGLIIFEETTTVVNGDYFNVTEVLKKYPGKRASEWYNSSRTQEYIKALSENVENPTINYMPTQVGRGGSTSVHKSLIIDFARWIDPKFAIKCDEFIYNRIYKQERQINELQEKAYDQQKQLDYFWDKEDINDLYNSKL